MARPAAVVDSEISGHIQHEMPGARQIKSQQLERPRPADMPNRGNTKASMNIHSGGQILSEQSDTAGGLRAGVAGAASISESKNTAEVQRETPFGFQGPGEEDKGGEQMLPPPGFARPRYAGINQSQNFRPRLE